MINGNSVNFQIGKESTFGTGVAPSVKLNISSESFNDVYTKSAEDLLTGGIAGGVSDTMEVATEGDFATLAKPSSVGYIMKGVLGVEADPTANADNANKYDHVFTPIGNAETDYLPSYSVTIDRKAAVKRYLGTTFNSLALSVAAGDRVQLTVSCLGYDADSGEIVSTLSDTGDDEKSFKFYQGKVKLGDVEYGDVTNIDFNYNNNADNSVQTLSTGKHHKQPQPGQRECTCGLTVVYSSEMETLRDSNWKEDATLTVELTFTDSDGNILKIELPKAQITEMAQANASGADTMSQELTVTAIDNSTAFVRATLTNDVSEVY